MQVRVIAASEEEARRVARACARTLRRLGYRVRASRPYPAREGARVYLEASRG